MSELYDKKQFEEIEIDNIKQNKNIDDVVMIYENKREETKIKCNGNLEMDVKFTFKFSLIPEKGEFYQVADIKF